MEPIAITSLLPHESALAYFPEFFPSSGAGGIIGGASLAVLSEARANASYAHASAVFLSTPYPQGTVSVQEHTFPFKTIFYPIPTDKKGVSLSYDDMLAAYFSDKTWTDKHLSILRKYQRHIFLAHFWVGARLGNHLASLLRKERKDVLVASRYHSQLSRTTQFLNPAYYASNPSSPARLAAEDDTVAASDVLIFSTEEELRQTARAYGKQTLPGGNVKQKSIVVPVIIDTQRYFPDDTKRSLRKLEIDKYFRQYNITHEDCIWMCVSRFDIEKGIYPFVKHFALWIMEHRQLGACLPKLIIVGGVANKAGAKKQFKQMHDFLHALPDVARSRIIVTNKAIPHWEISHVPDMAWHPSLEESFNISALEDQAAGIPVAVSRGPTGHRANHSDCTSLVFDFDPDSYTQSIDAFTKALDANFRKYLIRNGYRNAKRFSPAQCVTDLLAGIQRIQPDFFKTRQKTGSSYL